MERTYEEATEALHAGRKVAILRRHLLDKEPISKLCDEAGLQPTVFYRCQKEIFENGAFRSQVQSLTEAASSQSEFCATSSP
jgi:hypothetical protein